MKNEFKLYRVTLRGMTINSTGIAHGVSMVVAKNSEEAYTKVKEYLDQNDIGFSKDRELDKIELLASTYEYNNTGCILFL